VDARSDAAHPGEGLSRARFLRGGAVLAGAAALGATWRPDMAVADGGADPRPIPGGFDADFQFVPSDPLGHAYFPVLGLDLSTVTDFRGVVAATEVQGETVGTDGSEYWFDADMRLMEGEYVAVDGRLRRGAFAFV
jgi:hypothetical protein